MDFTIYNYVALFIATYFLMKHIIIHHLKKLPPSPPLCLPIIGHLYLLKRPLHRTLAQISAHYGPIFYLHLGSRPTIFLCSPSTIEECLNHNDIFVNRPNVLRNKNQFFNHPTIPWAPYGPHWRNLRRIAAVEILSPQRIQILSGIRAQAAQSFISNLMKNISKDEPVEMKSAIYRFTFDIMTRMLVGQSSYDQHGGSNTKIAVQRFQETAEEIFQVSGLSNLEDMLPVMKVLLRWRSTGVVEKMKKLNEKMEKFIIGFMEEHRRKEKEGTLNEAQKKCMLHVLLSLQKEDPKQYCDEMIGSFLLTLYMAGTETSASTIVWILSLLLNHPEVLKKTQHEMDTQVGHNRLVEESDKKNLQYIQCIVNETFRMYPTGAISLPYESRVDCQVAGYHVPQGTRLLYNIWAVHNDPEIWDEPRKFKAERFLGLQGKRFGCEFMPFGAGKRTCPGQHLAPKVVWLAAAVLVQCFEWERLGDELVDMKEGGGVTMVKVEPLLVKCRPRPCMIDLLSQL